MKLKELLNDTLLFEMPGFIPNLDFGLQDLKSNNQQTKTFLKLQNKKIIKKFDSDHILYTTPNQIVLIDTKNNLINYIVQYKIKYFKSIKNNTITQIKVFRRAGSKFVTGLPKQIFFDYLLPEYDVIITDTLQTKDGKRFWLDRIQDAYTKNLNVYVLDLSDTSQSFKPKNVDEIIKKEQQIWGDSNDHEYKIVAISNKILNFS